MGGAWWAVERAWARGLLAALLVCALTACSPAPSPTDGGSDAAGDAGEAYVALRVLPASAQVLVRESSFFQAELTLGDGRTRIASQAEVQWSSDAPAVATIDATGRATALTRGTATITARSHGLSASAVLEAQGRPSDRIQITPATATIRMGESLTFTAITWDADRLPIDVTAMATWDSSAPAIARFEARGVLRALAAGTTMVRATIGTIMSNAAMVTVGDPSVVSIALSPVTATLRPATPLQCVSATRAAIHATATLSNGTARDVTELAEWSSSAPMIASVSNEPGMRGVVSASPTMAGTANITARYMAVTLSPAVVTLLTDAGLAAFRVTPVNPTLCVTSETPITATITYADGRTADVTTMVTWTSSAPSIATVDTSTFRLRALAPGSATITASIPSDGTPPCTISNSTDVTVRPDAFTSFALTPARATIAVSGYQHYTASALDACGHTRVFDTDVVLTSSDPAVAVPVADNNVVGAAPGMATISADVRGLHAEATLEVTGP